MALSEVAPFAKTGGLADVGSALPKALKDQGHDIRVIMPQYRVINERKYVLRDVIRLQDIPVQLGKKDIQVNVKAAFIPNSKVQVYFIDYRPFFFREGLYVDPKTGKVKRFFSLPDPEACPIIDGIAFDGKNLWVTGKHCPSIFYIAKPKEKLISAPLIPQKKSTQKKSK